MHRLLPWLALVALVALGGGAYFLLNTGGVDPYAADAGASGGRVPGADEPVRGTDLDASDASPVAQSAFRDAGLAEEVGDRQSLSLLVVDETDAPIPGADIEAFRDDRADRGGRGSGGGGPFGGGGGDDRRRPMRTFKSDAEGLVHFDQAPRRPMELIGRAPKRVGMLSIDPTETLELGGSPFKLVLKPVKILEVAVVDPSGQPVPGVRVQATGEGFAQSRETGWTADPDGRALFQLTVLDGPIYEAELAEVSATMPGSPAVEAKAPFVNGVAKATLQAPPVVAVRLKAKPPEGEKVTDDLTLHWTIESGEAQRGGGVEFFRNAATGRRRFKGLTTVIGGFKPGASIRFRLDGDGRMETAKTVVLPTGGGVYELDMDVGLAQPYVVAKLVNDVGAVLTEGDFAYRVVQEGSASESAAEAGRGQGGGRQRGGRGGQGRGDPFARDEVTPDENGIVRVPVTPGFAGKVSLSETRGGRMRMFVGQDGEEPAAAPLAEREFAAAKSGERIRVADVVVPRKPILVAGRVVDAEGKPARRANVTLDLSQFTTDMFASFAAAGGPGVEQRRRGQNLGDLTDLDARTDEQGRFEVRAETTGMDLSGVKATAATVRGRAPAKAFTAGQADLELVLVEFGGIKGSVKLSSPEFTGAVSVRVRTHGETANDSTDFMRRMGGGGGATARVRGKEGAFELLRLLPGRYDVVFSYENSVALTVSNVEVKSGEVSADPRVQNVLLGAQFLVATVVVTDSAGAPVVGANVSYEATTSSAANSGATGAMARRGRGGFAGASNQRTDAQGRATRVFPEPPESIRVTVNAREYAPLSVDRAVFPLHVRLARGSTLVVAFDVDGGLPQVDGLEGWRVRLRDAAPTTGETPAGARGGRGGRPQGQGGGRGGFGGGGAAGETARIEQGGNEATLTALAPGDYSIRLEPIMAAGRRRGGAQGTPAEGGMPDFAAMFGGGAGVDVGAVTIPAGDGTLRFAVKPDAAVLKAIQDAIAR